MVMANKVMLTCKMRVKGQRTTALLGSAGVWERMVASEVKDIIIEATPSVKMAIYLGL